MLFVILLSISSMLGTPSLPTDTLTKVINSEEPPEYCYPTISEGKKGNYKLHKNCTYCPHKKECYKDCNDGKGIRAGKGKRRGRKYRTPKSVLIVLSENNGSEKAFRNLSGVDVTTSKDLNTELLAPGGDPGRLVVFSKAAVSALGERL